MIKAVIFDMDNLMIDSEVLHFEAYREVLSKLNIIFSKEDYLSSYMGISDKDIITDLVDKFSLPILRKELLGQKNEFFRNKFIHKVMPKKGLMDLLNNLQKDDYLLAVASGSQVEEIEIILKNLKINHYFKAIVSADFVEHGKPAPDIFLLAAKKLSIDPVNCLVLEDSPSGVAAAKKAGMKCYAIPSRETRDKDFSKADKILDSLEGVYFYLKKSPN